MKPKLIAILMVFFFLFSGIYAGIAHADDHGKSKKDYYALEDKFSHKSEMILSKKKDLELSDEQIKKIKDLKSKTKKDLIRMDAEIEVASVDLHDEMMKEPFNIAGINNMIDKKYGLKKDKAKYIVAAVASLKNILTEEQAAKFKDIYMKYKKSKKHGSMKEGKMKCSKMGSGT